jgi:chemosensory pili system protein ChpA (sensor histidine kinase/response regulator)
VPLPAIRRVVSLAPADVHRVGGVDMVEIEGEWLDLVHLDVRLGLRGRPAGTKIFALVLRSGGRSLVVAVDELLRKEEIVIKGLGEFLEGVGPFSGTAIAADGRLMLVLDPSRLRYMPDSARLADVRLEPPSAATGRVVLLVDDSVSVRKFVGAMLTKAGFTVHTAVDGADALDKLRGLTVDVVITDLELPRLNGYEMIEALRQRPATHDVPVVVLTTRSGEKHVAAARRLGVEHYISKPVNEAAFVDLVASLTASAAAPAAAENGHR